MDSLFCKSSISSHFTIPSKINDRKSEEMSLREAIEMVRRSNRLDLLVLKDDNLPPSYSTHSLPSTFRQKDGPRDRNMPNGYGEEQEPDIPPRLVGLCPMHFAYIVIFDFGNVPCGLINCGCTLYTSVWGQLICKFTSFN